MYERTIHMRKNFCYAGDMPKQTTFEVICDSKTLVSKQLDQMSYRESHKLRKASSQIKEA